MRYTRHNSSGFTLIELLVSTIITALVTGAATVALSQMVRARENSRAHVEAFTRAAAAADHIVRDLRNVVRDTELYITRVSITDVSAGSFQRDELMLVVRSTVPVRNDVVPEGADYEVAYKVVAEDSGESLWRRADPALDDAPDAGGVVRRVARSIVAVSVQAADSEEWYDIWDSDYDGLPHAVRVTVVAASDNGRVLATARRVVAIDRVPLPAAEEQILVEEGVG